MCFSVQASFITSFTLLLIGALTYKKCRTRQQRILAGAPLLFALQQALEGLVWVTLNNPGAYPFIQQWAPLGFLFWAYCVWPVYIPIATYGLEPNRSISRVIIGCTALGLLVACTGLYAIITGDYVAHIAEGHIAYLASTTPSWISPAYLDALQYVLLAAYTTVVILPLVLARAPYLNVLGILVSAGFLIAQFNYAPAFGSVWCFLAAIMSAIIYLAIDNRPEQSLHIKKN